MNELTSQEMQQASGGWLPLVGVALAVAGKVTATGPATWAVSSASLILGVYQAAEHYGGPSNSQYCIAPGG